MKDKLLPPVATLNLFLDQTSAVWNESGEQPVPNSQADLELASFPRRESVATAYTQAGMLFEAGTDYCMALIKSLTSPAQSIAPWGNARSVMEMSAMASWLWDIKINSHERVQRSLSFWHKGLVDQLKLANKASEMLDRNKVVAKLNYVEDVAQELRMGKVATKKGKREFGFDKEMPTITDIVTRMLNKEQEYRMLSAMVHGRNWALQAFGFEVMMKGDIFSGVKGGYLQKNLEYSHIQYLCIAAFTSLIQPILLKFKLYGLDARKMIILVKRTQQELAEIVNE